MALSTKPIRRQTTTVHHKKRVGQHQRQSKDFIKTYWPYLPLFALAAIVVIIMGAKVLGTPGAVIGTISVALAGISFLL